MSETLTKLRSNLLERENTEAKKGIVTMADGKQCGIMRTEKRKQQSVRGIQAENNRTEADKGKFPNSDIDWERTHENKHLMKSDDWLRTIKEELHKHGIEKYRKDAVLMLDTFYTSSPEFFQNKTKEEMEKYFKDCLEFHKKEYGDHVINAVIHYDETSPHMHVTSIPLVELEKDKYKLSAKEIMGNRGKYTQRQDRFYEEVTKGYGLERGEKWEPGKERRKHVEASKYNKWKAEQEAQKVEQVVASQKERAHEIAGRIREAETEKQKLIAENLTLYSDYEQLSIEIDQKKAEVTKLGNTKEALEKNLNGYRDKVMNKAMEKAVEQVDEKTFTDGFNAGINHIYDNVINPFLQAHNLAQEFAGYFGRDGYDAGGGR